MSKPFFQRTVALVLAAVLLVTSVAFTIMILIEMRQNDNDKAATTENINQNSEEAKMLKGTKLEGFTSVESVTELQKTDLQEGTGETVQPGATVTAHYTGALAKDGTIFESSHDAGEPASFPLANVIKGWQEGVPGMKVGGKRRLVIPASMAYGEAGSPPVIGPNEPLVFDIELVSVGAPQQ